MLKQSMALHTLCLSLNGNQVGDAGAQALSMLKESAALNILYLHPSDNQVEDACAQARPCQCLRTPLSFVPSFSTSITIRLEMPVHGPCP